jgi:hypothetical protein
MNESKNDAYHMCFPDLFSNSSDGNSENYYYESVVELSKQSKQMLVIFIRSYLNKMTVGKTKNLHYLANRVLSLFY